MGALLLLPAESVASVFILLLDCLESFEVKANADYNDDALSYFQLLLKFTSC